MKWGFRTPSLKKRISARLSWKRYARHSLGLKAPRGWGWLTDPKKAIYNRIYRRTTFGIEDLFKTQRRRKSQAGCFVVAILWMTFALAVTSYAMMVP